MKKAISIAYFSIGILGYLRSDFMKPIEMSSVTCRNFMKNSLPVFMYTSTISFLLCILFAQKGTNITRPMVLFAFLPILFVLFNAILNTLRWIVEYELCRIGGCIYNVTVSGYKKTYIQVTMSNTCYMFDTERAHRKHTVGEHLRVKAFKKFIYILN